jgi:hypothetical protein
MTSPSGSIDLSLRPMTLHMGDTLMHDSGRYHLVVRGRWRSCFGRFSE